MCTRDTRSHASLCALPPQFFRSAASPIAAELPQSYAMGGIVFHTWQQLARELVKLGGNHMSVSEDRDSNTRSSASGRGRIPSPTRPRSGLAAFALPPSCCPSPTRAGRAATGRHRLARLRARLRRRSPSCSPACGSSGTGTCSARTAFSTYGGFWIGLFFWIQRTAPRPRTGHDLGWILLAFAIFNTYMLLFSTQVNLAVFGVFLTLELTEIFLSIGNFTSSTGAGSSSAATSASSPPWSPGTPRRRASPTACGRLRIPCCPVGKPLLA